MSQFSISGAISGLDTASIIDGLVRVEGRQQALIQSRQAAAQKTSDAYGSLITSLNSIADQARELAKTSAWVGSSVTSSSTAVTASATGTGSGSFTFNVTGLAAAHTLVSANSVAAPTASVASGPLTLTKADGSTQTIQVGGGSLTEVVSAINNSGAGLRAAAVQTAPGEYRLQVAAATTGEASSFTLSGLSGFSGMDVLTAGADATITVGSNPATAYQVRSASNTFAGVVPGVSFTVSKLEDGVTVTSSVDGTAVADKVSKLVDAVNAALNTIGTQSTWNTTTKTGGPLTGEATVRQLQQALLATVNVGGASGAPAGVELTRSGRLTFNKDDFLKAFTADPQAVANAFGATASLAPAGGVTGSASLARMGDETAAGSYALQVTQAAAREEWRADIPAGISVGQTIAITQNGRTINYTVGPDDTLADVIAAINSQASSVGLGVTAASSGTSIIFAAIAAGAGQAFNVSMDGDATVSQTVAGRDIAGSIDGQTATGSGEVLTLSAALANGSAAAGLSVQVKVSDADVAASGGNVGSITVGHGLAQRLVNLIDKATDSVSGSLQIAKENRLADVKNLQDQIDAWSLRLEARRATLTRQFTAMEVALSSIQGQAGFLSGLPTRPAS